MQTLFPYDKVRPVQKGFMRQVEAAIINKTHLLAHCPTGIGKTAAALTPALAYAIENKKTVFFLTSRHTQHVIAIETLKKIKEKHNVNFSVVDLVGKKWMCCQKGVAILTASEFGEFCKELRDKGSCDYYKRLKRKNHPTFETQTAIGQLKKEPKHVEDAKQICCKLKVCPYEVACLLAKEAQVVIADYYHFLQPGIRDTLLKKLDLELNNCIIIMDEGHNLPARARKLLTTSMSTYMLEQSIKEAKAVEYFETADQLTELKNQIDSLASSLSLDKQERLITKKELMQLIENIVEIEELSGSLRFIAEEIIETKKRSFANGVANFLESWKGPDKSFVRILSRIFSKSKPYLNFSYKCLDPSLAMNDLVTNVHSIIVMSGTLTPTEMYRDLLGFNESTQLAEYDNPFPQENKLNLIVPKTSTKFTARSKKMYEQIAQECAIIVNNVPGNCVIFFPSYRFRDDVYVYLRSLCEKTTLLEEPGLTKQDKAEIIDSFKSFKDVGAVLLSVSAGSFGEGIDLVGDFLKSVVVVGLPLTKPDLETEELIKYYNEKNGKGWDYGYIMPAIITTMQNAGRCIRSATDKGIIVFMDERYVWPSYFNCFPKDWNMEVTLNVKKEIDKFYNQ
ncbi:MAG: ATP-dependent DNA helicase [Nanoarchaeota archaeon]|nr:ATP-dependent DNA helicase [Nanoarchaeota archaeon]